MSVARPVSVETLSSIPWMSAKSLSHAMREVSIRGPNDAETWQQLTSRADMIAKSFNAKQAALVLNSLARINTNRFPIDEFAQRFLNKFLPNILAECNGLDAAQILHATCAFDHLVKPEVFQSVVETLTRSAHQLDERSLSMVAAALCRVKLSVDEQLVDTLISRSVSISPLNDQTLAQVIHLASQGDVPVDHLCFLIGQATERMHAMALRSLVLITNSLTRFHRKVSVYEYIERLSESLMDDSSNRFSQGATYSQLVVLLRSLQKLHADSVSPLILHRVLDIINHRSPSAADTSSLTTLLSGLSRMSTRLALVDIVLGELKTRSLSGPETVTVAISLARLKTEDADMVAQISVKLSELDDAQREVVRKAIGQLDGL